MAIIDISGSYGVARVQLMESGYRITAFGDNSAEFDYGEIAEVVIAGHRYIAFVDLPEGAGDEGSEVESRLEHWLYEAEPIEGEPEDLDAEDEIEIQEGADGSNGNGQEGTEEGKRDGGGAAVSGDEGDRKGEGEREGKSGDGNGNGGSVDLP